MRSRRIEMVALAIAFGFAMASTGSPDDGVASRALPDPKLHPTWSRLLSEAERERTTESARWAKCDARVAKVLADHEARHPKHRSLQMIVNMNPPPSLATLDLGLPYLVHHLDIVEPWRGALYLDAIAASSDSRRVDFALEWASAFPKQGRFVASAMSSERAGEVISGLLDRTSVFERESALHHLLGRFADRIPRQDRQRAYELVRKASTGCPDNGPAGDYWPILLLIDAERTRQEAGGCFASKSYYVTQLFLMRPERSPLVAQLARDWLRPSLPAAVERDLRQLLVVSDPEAELPRYLHHLDRLLDRAASGESNSPHPSFADQHSAVNITSYLATLEECLAEESAQALRRLAVDLRIAAIDRLRILGGLVRSGDAEAGSLVRQTLERGREPLPSWVRRKLPSWGPTGAALARELAIPIPEEPQDSDARHRFTHCSRD